MIHHGSKTGDLNVLFLVVDSLRFDAAIEENHTNTPTLDNLLEESVVFTNCFSQGVSTAPAMTAVLTGRLPLDYGGHWYLEDGQPTFAEQFRRNGYSTGAVHSNPYVSKRRNFDRGFDDFQQNVVAFEPDRGLERTPEKLRRIASRVARVISRTPYTPAPEVNNDILSFIDRFSSPWFCWAQYMDVHGPYLGGEPTYRKKFRSELLWQKAAVRSPDKVTDSEHKELWQQYIGDIEYLDKHIGELIYELERREILEETIIVLTSDHGDEFHEHDRYGHGNLPYSELTHVPLVIRFPESADTPSMRIDNLVQSLDILPTVLDAVGADLDSEMEKRAAGQSLLPAIDGTSVDHEYVVTEKRIRGKDGLRIGFRDEEWTFLYDGKDDSMFLYNRISDPSEQENSLDDYPNITKLFQDRLGERLAQIRRTSENVTVPDMTETPAVEERLRALGYRD